MSKPFYRFTFPNSFVAVDIINDFGVKHEEPTAYPAFLRFGFFIEFNNAVLFKCNSAKTSWKAHCRHGSQFPMGMVKFQESFDIKIRHSITIGKHKGLILA